MTSTHGQSLTTNSVITLITRCFDSYCNGSAAVKTAAQATVNQTLTSFCIMLQETSGGHEVSLFIILVNKKWSENSFFLFQINVPG